MLSEFPFRSSILFILFLLVLSFGCAQQKQTAQREVEPDPRWRPVDSLNKIGLYASALEITDKILAEARNEGDWRNVFKAQMYRAKAQQFTGIDQERIIGEMERFISTLNDSTDVPLKQLMHSVIGQAYWQHYQNERWLILDRTNLEAISDTAGMETWDQRRYMRQVIHHFRSSLQPFDTLRHIPAGELGELLEWPYDTLRPFPGDPFLRSGRFEEPLLMDVLARRAIGIFRNSETRIAEPAWRFKLDRPEHFALFEEFTLRDLVHRDSLSWEFQALRTWQRWERAHLADDHPFILADIMLQRLGFVRDHSTLPQKDSLYYDALVQLRKRVELQPVWSEVTVAMAEFHAQKGAQFQRLDPGDLKWELRTAVQMCDSAITRFPGSFGAQKARILKAGLLRPAIDLRTEEATIPGSPFKVALGYRNVQKVWLRIVMDGMDVAQQRSWDHDHLGWLLQQKAIREWQVELPDDGDHHRHVVELPVEGLPIGRYSILVSTDEGFRNKVDQIAFAAFWSTRISVAERSEGSGIGLLLLDRHTGAALRDAKAELYIMDPRQSDRNFKEHSEHTADAEGRVQVELDRDHASTRWLISLPDGDLFITGSNYHHRDRHTPSTDTLRTFLFTDRAIYRPGQEVFFKGIVTVKRVQSTVTKADHPSTVKLFDANGQLTDSITLTADRFGAFHGSFRAPGGLTGGMNISTEHGSVHFTVEEYKRPTFEVVFDTITTTAQLNDTAEVSAIAKSYAGVPLDGSEVRWTVQRMARMPWWSDRIWGGFPGWGRPVEVASGTTTTDGEGKFHVRFVAAADKDLPLRSDPIFMFTVEASVTDISGETQIGNTSLSLGYKSVEVDLGIGEAIDRSTADSLSVTVKNLNGIPIDRPVDVRVHRLRAPELPLRDRLWEAPDRFVITTEAHSALFPFDPFSNEDDPLEWSRDSIILELSQWNSRAKKIELKNIEDWIVGPYLIEVITTDPQGNTVQIEKPITLFDHEIQNTGFIAEALHVEQLRTVDGTPLQPEDKAKFLISTGLDEARIGMEVERDGHIVVSRWFALEGRQQLIEIPVLEEDRGGFAVHFIGVANGREFRSTHQGEVPWKNKELQVEWITFRDKMLPGEKEEFRLRILGSKGDQVAAQLLATMYDASLDHFVPHAWEMFRWPGYQPRKQWSRMEPFGSAHGQVIGGEYVQPRDTVRPYPGLNTFGWPAHLMRYMMMDAADGGAVLQSEVRSEESAPNVEMAVMDDSTAAKDLEMIDGSGSSSPQSDQPVRRDLRETAFFLPDLLTDRDGSVILRFTMPDALTRWRLMGLAHTTDLQIAQFDRTTITQKPMMVVPNLPRFLREGDHISITSKINALESDAINGEIRLELFDPRTNNDLVTDFNLSDPANDFTAAPGSSGLASWELHVPKNVDLLGIRIMARGDQGISDGEEHVLPILSDRLLVTESMPLPITKAGTKNFTFGKLKNNTSSTLRHESLKLEFTPNPAWYAVQALPYLAEFPHECSEQVFSRYYANRLAAHIVEERPAIKSIVQEWKAEGAESFMSNLEKNQDLKAILLEETPWVMRAQDERERKERIALLFDMERMAREEAASIQKLQELQRQDGSWPWFGGMFASRSITQHIVAGIGHLQRLGAADLDRNVNVQQMLDRAIRWMDKEADRWYKELKKHNDQEELEKFVPGYTEVQYLYARSFFPDRPYSAGAAQAAAFIRDRVSAEWLKYGLQEQTMIALLLHRSQGEATGIPDLILRSLKERSTRSEELGMYWKNFTHGMEWWSFPTETHALAIEAFHEIAEDQEAVNELRIHLLKLKQTTDWRTTKATAHACYALLLTGPDLLDEVPAPKIIVGQEEILPDKKEAGTGYFTQVWNADEVRSEMGEVSITTTTDRVAWGALHWQYFEQMDRITPHESPFNINKQVMLRRQTGEGARLLTLQEAGTLQPGDRLTIRIELRTDRYVDFVHMKDLRAAGLEPVEKLSGHKWQGGLGYYQSIRDAGMHFFFDRIPPGTHVFEYDLHVTHAGDFSNGITSAMCMYAPEFSSHSAGQRIVIE